MREPPELNKVFPSDPEDMYKILNFQTAIWKVMFNEMRLFYYWDNIVMPLNLMNEDDE